MSVVANFIGTLDYPEFYAFISGAEVAVYPVEATNKLLTLAGYTFINDTAGAVQCKLYHVDAMSSVKNIVWTGSVPANSSVVVESNPVRLKPSDVVRGLAASGVTLKLSLIMQLENSR